MERSRQTILLGLLIVALGLPLALLHGADVSGRQAFGDGAVGESSVQRIELPGHHDDDEDEDGDAPGLGEMLHGLYRCGTFNDPMWDGARLSLDSTEGTASDMWITRSAGSMVDFESCDDLGDLVSETAAAAGCAISGTSEYNPLAWTFLCMAETPDLVDLIEVLAEDMLTFGPAGTTTQETSFHEVLTATSWCDDFLDDNNYRALRVNTTGGVNITVRAPSDTCVIEVSESMRAVAAEFGCTASPLDVWDFGRASFVCSGEPDEIRGLVEALSETVVLAEP